MFVLTFSPLGEKVNTNMALIHRQVKKSTLGKIVNNCRGQSWETWAKPTSRFENGEQKGTMHRNESCKVETTSPLNSDLRFGDQP